jgi:transposase InsO family protein
VEGPILNKIFQKARDLAELQAIVGERIRYYSRIRRHSALGNEAPWAVLQKLVCARDA